MKRNNEEIVYRILKKNLITLVLIPLLVMGTYFGYSKFIFTSEYTTSSSVLVNGDANMELDNLDMYIRLTTTFTDFAKSSAVLENASLRLGGVLAPMEISKAIEIWPKTNSQIISILVKSPSDENVAEIAVVVAEALKEEVEKIYGDDMIQIIDLPEKESVIEVKSQLDKVTLVVLGAGSFFLTLLIVLMLGFKKIKK